MPVNTFWYRTPLRRRDSSNTPAALAVPNRAPIAPKIVPRMPVAAGSRMYSEGSSLSVAWIDEVVMPAISAASVLTTSATKPWRRVRCSDRQ